MPANTKDGTARLRSRWRTGACVAAALVLLLPAVAMQFTGEVRWDAADFAFAGLLLAGAGVSFELAMKQSQAVAYRAGAGVALAAAFLLVWLNAAVGIIGSEDNDANLMYGAVLGVGIVGAVIARFQARGMALTLASTASAQAMVAVVALVAGFDIPGGERPEILVLNGFFVGLWAASALMFRTAARRGDAGAAE